MPYRFETLQIHAEQGVDATTQPRVAPLYQTSAYAFNSADHAARLFALQASNSYLHTINPTKDVLEKRSAALAQVLPQPVAS